MWPRTISALLPSPIYYFHYNKKSLAMLNQLTLDIDRNKKMYEILLAITIFIGAYIFTYLVD